MAAPSEQALMEVAVVRRSLRDIKGVKESRPGVFQVGNSPLVTFRDEGGGLIAELANAGSGLPAQRYRLTVATEVRKLVEETRRRAARILDE